MRSGYRGEPSPSATGGARCDEVQGAVPRRDGDPALGGFWAAATGCAYVARARTIPGDVVGDVEGMGIALCPVPEPKTVKHRVHLDVHTDSVDAAAGAGCHAAPGYDDDDRWTVLLDPEGGELCAFVREELPAYRPTR